MITNYISVWLKMISFTNLTKRKKVNLREPIINNPQGAYSYSKLYDRLSYLDGTKSIASSKSHCSLLTAKPFQYFARTMTDTEKRYSAFGRKLLAAFAALKKFRHHLEGPKFTLFTYHKALVDAVEKPHLNEKRVLRAQRQLEFLCSMVKEERIKHILGKQNIVADFLSRAFNNICRLLISEEDRPV